MKTVGRLSITKNIILAVSLIGMIVILIAIFIIFHHRPKYSTPSFHTATHKLTDADIISADQSAINQALDTKDYQTALNNYYEAVNLAENNNNFNQAKTLLLEAINKIPNDQLTWQIWDDLVGVARTLGDKTLEISSLQKAIIKARQADSGAPDGVVKTYQQRLQQLGASQ